MNIEEIRKKVRERLSTKRYIHTLGVEKKAVELAILNNSDEDKARIAALLHDYLKQETIVTLKNLCEGIEEIKGYEGATAIFHGLGAEKILRNEFNIDDIDIINAVKYHTIGRENMSLLEKIIYIADAIEDGRDYEGVDETRKLTAENINKGIISEIKRNIKDFEKRQRKIHTNTIKMLNFLEREEKN